jgi:hypothetical protein
VKLLLLLLYQEQLNRVNDKINLVNSQILHAGQKLVKKQKNIQEFKQKLNWLAVEVAKFKEKKKIDIATAYNNKYQRV